MPRILVVAGDPTKCGGELVEHRKLGGAVCTRCGSYYDDVYLRALKLALPLTCGEPRVARASN